MDRALVYGTDNVRSNRMGDTKSRVAGKEYWGEAKISHIYS